jgi:hypothetical protein
MPLSFEPADIRYIAYVDEAGDPGLKTVRPIDRGGASEWFCVGAILIQAYRERETVAWVKNIRSLTDAKQSPDLHYRNLGDSKRAIVCNEIAALPVRCFAFISNKKNMRQHRNERAALARPSGQEYFYNYCVRLLMERITDFVERHSIKNYGEPKQLRMVFSERGGVRYAQTTEYHDLLRQQARSKTTFLKKREVKWRVMHPASNVIIPHNQNAGVQLADPIASSFYQAVNTAVPSAWNTSFAEALKPRIPTENGSCEDYGVTLQPQWWKAKLTPDQQKIFRFYGYAFK